MCRSWRVCRRKRRFQITKLRVVQIFMRIAEPKTDTGASDLQKYPAMPPDFTVNKCLETLAFLGFAVWLSMDGFRLGIGPGVKRG